MDEIGLVGRRRKHEKYLGGMIKKDSLILEISSPYGPIFMEDSDYHVLGVPSLFSRSKETYPKEMGKLLPEVEGFDWSKPSAIEKKIEKALEIVGKRPGITAEEIEKVKNGVSTYNSIKMKALEVKISILDDEIKQETARVFGKFKYKQ